MKKHIGFLFNHEAAHQVSHLAPMVPALASYTDDVRITVLASTREQLDIARRMIGNPPNCQFILLGMSRLYHILDTLIGKIAPLRRYATLKDNLDIFRTMDALIVPERTSLLLRQRFGLKDLKLIRVCHGAGDRDVAWSQNISEFDFVMLPGAKHRNRMLELGIVQPESSAVIGYMKFDAMLKKQGQKQARGQHLFNNDKPTVLYNPHFDPHLSSWYKMGEEVLNYFAGNPNYNLIFAPHIMLFKRRLHTSLTNKIVRWRKNISKKFYEYDNILIDTGSLASIDMTYVNAADVYLGDVSSQVYEFIAQPRPCIFLNAHDADWKNDPQYRFWLLGPVVETIDELDKSLTAYDQHFDAYSNTQKKIFSESIDLQHTSSAQRAAEIFCSFMSLEPCPPAQIKKYG